MLSSPCCFPIQIAAGTSHALCLIDSGEIIAWGSNMHAQLGIESGAQISEPQRISTFHNVPAASIACGGSHNVCICSNGSIYSWGDGMYGQLGQGLNVLSSPQPLQITKLKGVDIQAICCGQNHSLFLSSNGTVYACGNGFYGQLGLEVGIDYVFILFNITYSSFLCLLKNWMAIVLRKSPVEKPFHCLSVITTSSLLQECSKWKKMSSCRIDLFSRFPIAFPSTRKLGELLLEPVLLCFSLYLEKCITGLLIPFTQIFPLYA